MQTDENKHRTCRVGAPRQGEALSEGVMQALWSGLQAWTRVGWSSVLTTAAAAQSRLAVMP